MDTLGSEEQEHLSRLLHFAARFQWIYDFQLTRFLCDRVWENVPPEWLTCLCGLTTEELNGVPYGDVKDDWPDSLREFIHEAQSLSLPRACAVEQPEERSQPNNVPPPSSPTPDPTEPRPSSFPGNAGFPGDLRVAAVTLSRSAERGMNPKKRHEVRHLAGAVHAVCREARCRSVVDVGAGLGYVSHTLHDVFRYSVLALEGQESRTHGAVNRANKLDLSGVRSATFRLGDSPDSFRRLESLLAEAFPENRDVAMATTGNSCAHCDTCCDVASVCDTNPHYRSETEDGVNCTCSAGSEPCSNHVDGSRCSCDVQGDANEFAVRVGNETESCSGSVRGAAMTRHEATSGVKDSVGVTASPEDAPDSSCVEKREGKLVLRGTRRTAPSNATDDACAVTEPDGPRASPGGGGTCMIGLHCCGTLTPTMLRAFSQSARLSALVLVSCCYHAMPVNERGDCEAFPLSAAGREAAARTRAQFPALRMGTFALRLAAQETRARWRRQSPDDHAFHVKNVAFRAVLEMFAQQDSSFVKLKRRLARRRDYATLDTYLDAVLGRTSLGQGHRKRIRALHDEQRVNFRYIEPVTALQVVMQPVLESLLQADRVLFLRERGGVVPERCGHGPRGAGGFRGGERERGGVLPERDGDRDPEAGGRGAGGLRCGVLPVFDESVSPRNLALVAVKTDNK